MAVTLKTALSQCDTLDKLQKLIVKPGDFHKEYAEITSTLGCQIGWLGGRHFRVEGPRSSRYTGTICLNDIVRKFHELSKKELAGSPPDLKDRVERFQSIARVVEELDQAGDRLLRIQKCVYRVLTALCRWLGNCCYDRYAQLEKATHIFILKKDAIDEQEKKAAEAAAAALAAGQPEVKDRRTAAQKAAAALAQGAADKRHKQLGEHPAADVTQHVEEERKRHAAEVAARAAAATAAAAQAAAAAVLGRRQDEQKKAAVAEPEEKKRKAAEDREAAAKVPYSHITTMQLLMSDVRGEDAPIGSGSRVTRPPEHEEALIKRIRSWDRSVLQTKATQYSENHHHPEYFEAFVLMMFKAHPIGDAVDILESISWPASMTEKTKKKLLLEGIVSAVQREVMKQPPYESDLFDQEDAGTYSIVHNPKIKVQKLCLSSGVFGSEDLSNDSVAHIAEGIAIAVNEAFKGSLQGAEVKEKAAKGGDVPKVGFGLSISEDWIYDRGVRRILQAFLQQDIPGLCMLDIQRVRGRDEDDAEERVGDIIPISAEFAEVLVKLYNRSGFNRSGFIGVQTNIDVAENANKIMDDGAEKMAKNLLAFQVPAPSEPARGAAPAAAAPAPAPAPGAGPGAAAPAAAAVPGDGAVHCSII